MKLVISYPLKYLDPKKYFPEDWEIIQCQPENLDLNMNGYIDVLFVKGIPISEDMLIKCNNLKVIINHEPRLDNIPLNYCNDRAIEVHGVSECVTEPTARMEMEGIRKIKKILAVE